MIHAVELRLLATDFVFICSGFSTWHRRISCIWNCQCKFQIYTILSYVFASLPSVRPWMRSSIVPACVPWWGHRECKRPYTFPSFCASMDEVIHSARLRPLMRSSRVQAALHVPFPLLFSSILPMNLLFSVVIFNSLTLFRLHVLAALSWTEPGPR